MESTPTKLANLKDLLALMSCAVQAQKEIADILSDYEKRVYSLEEDRRKLLAIVRKQEDSIKVLNNRYSEVLYKLSNK